MRILYVAIDGEVSGGNNICSILLKAAQKQGYQVELLAPHPGKLTELLDREGIQIHFFNLARSFQFHKSVQLAFLLKKRDITLVHTHTTLYRGEILCRIACWIAGIPIICHQHDPADIYNQNPVIFFYQRWLDRITSKIVKQFAAVSKERQRLMIQLKGYPRNRVELIYNGIDIESFSSQESRDSVRSKWFLQQQQIAIGLIARLEFPKGQGTLIEAIPDILNSYPEAKFFIIGDDRFPGQPCLTQYRRMIQALKIENSCFLLGFQTNIERLIQGLDIIVLPSWWEGHPLILLEALAARKPVIASSVGGTPEIIQHQQTGWLIPPRNPEALAQAVCAAIAQPELAQKLADRGYEYVKEYFDQKQMIAKVLSLYRRIEADGKSSSGNSH